MTTIGPRQTRASLLTVSDLSRTLGVPEQTIYVWRSRGTGPRGIRIGRHLRFRPEDVEQWLDERAAADLRY